ncbi:MAG: zinc ABC transporter substrate-binding protein [Planctomycetes bacterium]|nr:zinc ABC transporter substrate-binding protein [Planctomycetota bacterium]
MKSLCFILGVTAVTLSFRTGEALAAPQDFHACATTPDLASLLREIGGDRISVTVFSKPSEDPHFLEAKPSFVKCLSQSRMLVLTGLELEAAYLPVLLQNARNERVLRGAPGYVDASTVIEAREVPRGPVDRSQGDVHAYGNPHYLLDPLNAVRVAELLRDRLSAARPDEKKTFAERFDAFRRKTAEALLGKPLAEKYASEFEKLVKLHEYGKMLEFLKAKGDDAALGGWLKALAPYHGAKIVTDHNLWTYFAARFGLTVMGSMEPRPGIPPTTRHLGELVERMKAQGAKAILAAPYYDPRHANFLAKQTGVKIATMAHQPGSRKGTDDYLSMIDYDVKQVASALGAKP